jgi:tetratricopeptide (TPR) repeat protein
VAALQVRAREFRERGRYRAAENCLHRGLAKLGPRSGATPLHLAVWNDLGVVYKYLGEFKTALKFYHLALRHSNCLTGRERDDFLASLYHNLGGTEHARRQFKRGEQYARKSLQFRARVAGTNSIAIAADRAALAAILDGRSRFEESQKLYRQALKTYRRVYGKSHREIALILNNLAAVYLATGRPTLAEAHCKAALTMKRQELGETHPDFSITMNNLAMLYGSLGRREDAQDCFKKAIKLLDDSLGKSHPTTLAVKRNFRKHKLHQ